MAVASKSRGDGERSSAFSREMIIMKAQMTHLWTKEKLHVSHAMGIVMLLASLWIFNTHWYVISHLASIFAEVGIGVVLVLLSLYLIVVRRK